MHCSFGGLISLALGKGLEVSIKKGNREIEILYRQNPYPLLSLDVPLPRSGTIFSIQFGAQYCLGREDVD